MLLRSVENNRKSGKAPSRFPYTVPFVREFTRVDFASAVTFLVGENGSGKSTFLEALACAIGSTTVGSESVATDQSLAAIRKYAQQDLRLIWSKRTKKGFFMRSEDFFGYARRMSQVRAELEAELDLIDEEYREKSQTARNLARMPFRREIGEMQRAYGESLDSHSHGEAFFELFRERFVGEGLYLLDEPEAPLSPTRQMSLITMIKMMVDAGGQFIIATHSPILMAFPGATILSFDEGVIAEVDYETLEHVIITRDFLNNPDKFLKYLLE